jgi:hypothetical protein
VTAIYERTGDFALPIPDSLATGNLSALDPVRGRLLGLFRAALTAELATVWGQVSGTSLDGKAVVQSTLELEPTHQVVQAANLEYPLLALHRSGPGVVESQTLEIDKVTQTWTLHYILGPLDVASQRKLCDILIVVPRIIQAVIRRRGHEAYESGALQFFPDTGGLQSIRIVNFESGSARFAGNDVPIFAVTVNLEIAETVTDVPGAEGDFDSVSMDVGIGGGEGVIHGLLFADTDAPYQEP